MTRSGIDRFFPEEGYLQQAGDHIEQTHLKQNLAVVVGSRSYCESIHDRRVYILSPGRCSRIT